MAIITLTTDFGRQDNFVGVMKGVILGINPEARLVDLTHEVPPQDVAAGAFVLLTAYPYFPAGTVHLAVVDPGVGSARAVIAVRAAGQTFIAPDNGLVSYVLDQEQSFEARRVENPALRLAAVSQTFHGRDIMAPAAAHLSLGRSFPDLGPPAEDLIRLEPVQARVSPDRIEGRVISVDRFGNLITSVSREDLGAWAPEDLVISVGPLTITGLARSYSSVKPGADLAVLGSSGFVEIARNLGRAEQKPDLTLGTPVVIKRGG